MTLISRLKKLGIEITMWSNYPWLYLMTVNSKKVEETYMSEHCFTMGFFPVKRHSEFQFTDLTEIFRILRKYSVPTRQVITEKFK
jgi:hypothetical protein